MTTLTELRGRGYKVGLLSNCGEEVPGIWEGTPAAHLFDASVYSCAVGLAKPDPELYRLACGRLNVSPNECLYVGDGSDYELRHAALVGMCPVLIRVPYESLDDPYHPDAKDWQGRAITSLSEVLLLLSGD